MAQMSPDNIPMKNLNLISERNTMGEKFSNSRGEKGNFFPVIANVHKVIITKGFYK